MSGIKDTATVTLNVNGAQAKQMMADLEAKVKQAEANLAHLQQTMADPKAVEKARKELKNYQKQLDEMKSATEGVGKALSSLDTATPRQLEKALRTLNKQLKDMTPGTEVWQSHIEKIQELKARLGDLSLMFKFCIVFELCALSDTLKIFHTTKPLHKNDLEVHKIQQKFVYLPDSACFHRR